MGTPEEGVAASKVGMSSHVERFLTPLLARAYQYEPRLIQPHSRGPILPAKALSLRPGSPVTPQTRRRSSPEASRLGREERLEGTARMHADNELCVCVCVCCVSVSVSVYMPRQQYWR